METKNYRNQVSTYIEAKQISQENIDAVLELSHLKPTLHEFLAYLRMLLVWVGAISLIMALLFFMAFNWNEFGRFSKFIMVEIVMTVTVIAYLLVDKYKLLQKVLLMVASIALGVLLALIGQTYQTGADPWQLFAVWALLMTPWAVVAGFSGIWILWIALMNLGVLLYFQKFDLSPWAILQMHENLLLVFFTLNSVLWIVWEVLSLKYKTFKNQMSINFLAFLSIASVTTLTVLNLFWVDEIGSESVGNRVYFIVYALCMFTLYYVYRVRKLSIYMVSLFSLSVFIVSMNIFILFMIQTSDNFLSFLILLIFFIMLVTTYMVSWLKKLKKELK